MTIPVSCDREEMVPESGVVSGRPRFQVSLNVRRFGLRVKCKNGMNCRVTRNCADRC